MKQLKKKRTAEGKVIHLKFEDYNLARDLFGSEDRHLKSIERMFGIDIHVRGNDLRLEGRDQDVEAGERVLNKLYELLNRGDPIMGEEIGHALKVLSRDAEADVETLLRDAIFLPARHKAILPRTQAQKRYVHLIKENDIVFSVGPAGTGKSYLAVAMAVTAVLRKEFRRIVLARPAVEAGEKLGFLPGDMQQKVNPYLRPLYDALHDMLEVERVEEMIEEDIIEIAPIAFMRGRTLHDAFVILDEAQNCSYHQMKMCLTRLGPNSKMVITGDVTQIDLPRGTPSGLLEAMRILKGAEGIAFHAFTSQDVVRHPLVQRIVAAYQIDEDDQS